MSVLGQAWCDTCGMPLEWVSNVQIWKHAWTNAPRPSKIPDRTKCDNPLPVLDSVDA